MDPFSNKFPNFWVFAKAVWRALDSLLSEQSAPSSVGLFNVLECSCRTVSIGSSERQLVDEDLLSRLNFFQSVDDQHVNAKVEYDIGIGTAGVIDYTSAKTGIESTETY